MVGISKRRKVILEVVPRPLPCLSESDEVIRITSAAAAGRLAATEQYAATVCDPLIVVVVVVISFR